MKFEKPELTEEEIKMLEKKKKREERDYYISLIISIIALIAAYTKG